MSKLFLLFASGAIMALILTRRLRSTAILQPSLNVSPPRAQRRRLLRYRDDGRQRWKGSISDPRTVDLKDGDAAIATSKLTVCERSAPIRHDVDLQMMLKYGNCPFLNEPPERTTLFVLDGLQTFGRTGNNLIEFLHSFQYAKDNEYVLAIKHGSWVPHLITIMWMAVLNDDIASWRAYIEQMFCVKIFDDDDDLEKYMDIKRMKSKDLFMYRSRTGFDEYVEFQGFIIRNLWRAYNKGVGTNMRQKPVADMCSVTDAIFGDERKSAVYSVIHSRTLEGEPGLRLSARICNKAGCDPVAALNMDPDYIKAILAPLGMLDYPIVFITDHQRPEILEKIMADPEIGPNIQLIPEEASWIGGDITVAVMADVFIGVPASSFSGFIAKSRLSLGFDKNFLFRNKTEGGEWVNSCEDNCIFNERVMNAMA